LGLGENVAPVSIAGLQLFKNGSVLRNLLSVPRSFGIVGHLIGPVLVFALELNGASVPSFRWRQL
jgi:hypothetical protein